SLLLSWRRGLNIVVPNERERGYRGHRAIPGRAVDVSKHSDRPEFAHLRAPSCHQAGSGCSCTLLNGGTGDDEIDGSDISDWIDGGPGDDVLRGHDGGDDIRGGTGMDDLWGGDGDDFLSGNAFRDCYEYSEDCFYATDACDWCSGGN